jgi:hypothetical protein
MSFTFPPLYPRANIPFYTFYMRRGGPQSRSGLDAVEKRKISWPCRESNPSLPVRSLSLYQLSYSGFKRYVGVEINLRIRWKWVVSHTRGLCTLDGVRGPVNSRAGLIVALKGMIAVLSRNRILIVQDIAIFLCRIISSFPRDLYRLTSFGEHSSKAVLPHWRLFPVLRPQYIYFHLQNGTVS